MILRLTGAILMSLLFTGLSVPVNADTTTRVWPITQAFGVAVSPDGESLWVSSGTPTNTLTRLNANTGAIEAVIALAPAADYPQEIVVSPDGLNVYVTAQNSNTVSVVSTTTNAVVRTISLGFLPAGIAISSDGATLFVADYFGGQVHALTTTGTSRGFISTGSGPVGVAYSSVDERIYVANMNSDSISVISVANPSAMSSVGTVAVSSNFPRLLAVTPDGSQVWVPSQGNSTVSVITTATLTETDTVNAPVGTESIAINPQGTRAFVVSFDNASYGTLLEFSTATKELLSSTALGYVAGSIAVSPDGQTVYVKSDGEVWVVTYLPEPLTGENIPVAAMQQFELVAGTTCDQVPEYFVDFPGISASLRTVGWSQSWAQWARDGQGGPVCSRQPFYTSAGTWAVG